MGRRVGFQDVTEQSPIGSGFNAASTAAEVIGGQDLSGKVAIVTGGYSGLGLAGVRALAQAGAKVVVPARSAEKAREAIGDVTGLELETLDLMDPESIDGFAERFLATGRPLHMLLNNAGVMATPLIRDSRGYEGQLSTNHLGHFQLTARLWPALRKAGGARVVSVSSKGHGFASVNLEDPNFERREYDPWKSYGQSKSANILFALHLDTLGQADGVRAFSVHPGIIMTNLARHLDESATKRIFITDERGERVIDPASGHKTPEQGAATMTWCAVSPKLAGEGGVYCEDCDIAMPAAPGRDGGVAAWGTDRALARDFWALSETLTGAGL